MKTVIIDDEKNAVLSLELAIKEYCPELKVTGTATSAKDGISLIHELQPDLVFLDIQMPHMTGIELLETFGDERKFEVIFVTAFNDFAIKAFRLSAMDYLLKPLNITELISSVKKMVKNNHNMQAVSVKVEKLKAALSGKIAIPLSSGTEFVLFSNIVRIEADGSYCHVHFLDQKPCLVSRNLKDFQFALEGESFFRVHKSHLINLRHIKKYSPVKDGGTIEMADGSVVEIARTQKQELGGLLQSFIKNY